MLLVLIILVSAVPVFSQSPAGDVVGKLVVGYQGWFTAQGDGSPKNAWVHWARNISPRRNNVTFELYPDTREYSRLYRTDMANLGNGEPARLFSSWDPSTVDLHFKWMQQYNIDVAALQRSGAAFKANPKNLNHANGIAASVQLSAEKYDRKFYITWDVSDWPNFSTELIDDMDNLRNRKVFTSKAYAIQNGKPVVCIWGFGFINRPNDPNGALNLIYRLKQQGFYVIGGVPANWRTGDSDSLEGYLDVYTAFNMIQPWSVGRFGGVEGAHNYQAQERADYNFCRNHSIDYQPVLFPGFAWSNWNNGIRNAIPRQHGDFLWRQFVNVREIGIKNSYIAMFDEYDEGTAIAKAAENRSMIPTDQYFLTLDADGVNVSSDFYLRVAGEGNRMMKGEVELKNSHNVPFYITVVRHVIGSVPSYPCSTKPSNSQSNQSSHPSSNPISNPHNPPQKPPNSSSNSSTNQPPKQPPNQLPSQLPNQPSNQPSHPSSSPTTNPHNPPQKPPNSSSNTSTNQPPNQPSNHPSNQPSHPSNQPSHPSNQPSHPSSNSPSKPSENQPGTCNERQDNCPGNRPLNGQQVLQVLSAVIQSLQQLYQKC